MSDLAEHLGIGAPQPHLFAGFPQRCIHSIAVFRVGGSSREGNLPLVMFDDLGAAGVGVAIAEAAHGAGSLEPHND